MKNFLVKLLLFSLPLLIPFTTVNLVLLNAGELEKGTILSQNYAQGKYDLVGLACSEAKEYLKFQATLLIKPEVLIMGSSRVLTLRSDFFKSNATFFNAGGAVNNSTSLVEFGQLVFKDHAPKIVVLGLDPWWFNKNFIVFEEQHSYYFYNLKQEYSKVFNTGFTYFRQGKIPIGTIWSAPDKLIGLNAIINKRGYRKDGSFDYGSLVNEIESRPVDDRFVETLQRIDDKNKRFEHCKAINSVSVDEIQVFLTMCKNNNIKVIGFLPPFSKVVFDKMYEQKEEYADVFKLMETLTPLFIATGNQLYDYTSVSSLMIKDDEFIDGFHCGERAMANIMLDLSKRNSDIAFYLAAQDIQEKIARTKSALKY